MSSPINSMVYSVCKCVRCGKGMGECLSSRVCMENCSCGWFREVGKQCNNDKCIEPSSAPPIK